MFVSTPIGKSTLATKILNDDSIMIGDRELPIDMIILNLKDFDITMGMNWLATYNALVDYFNKKETFQILSKLEFCLMGSFIDIPQFISTMKAHSLLRKGSKGIWLML